LVFNLGLYPKARMIIYKKSIYKKKSPAGCVPAGLFRLNPD